MAKIALAWAILYTLVLTFFSLYKISPGFQLGEFTITDKMLHTGAYFVLMASWSISILLQKEGWLQKNKNLLLIIFFNIAFGIFIEVMQGVLTSYRQPDFFDVIANTTGVLLAALIFLIFKQKLKVKK
ncbi:VanZ family protein [Zunongwangia sp.]|uniref:VanZ family protein n=1 Tax=Zunongwangia sp. TaxID=1965325 RepID=UPI003AA90C28